MTVVRKKLFFITQQTPSLSTGNEYLCRMISLLMFLTGLLQISVGVAFLLTCRHALQPIPCVFVLKAHPCNGLEVSGYGGILNIAISSLGLSCLGRRPSAVLLLIVALAEFLLALQFLHAKPILFKDYFRIPTLDDICKNHSLQPGRLSLCWRSLESMYPTCSNHTNRIQISCPGGEHKHYDITSPSSRLDFTSNRDVCAYLINERTSLIYTNTRHVAGITILFLDGLCILLAFFLIYLHQKQKQIKERNKLLEQNGISQEWLDKNFKIQQNEDFL